ncbi:MAG: hypothetical protein AB8B55_12530 [Mariniblastus sp.]
MTSWIKLNFAVTLVACVATFVVASSLKAQGSGVSISFSDSPPNAQVRLFDYSNNRRNIPSQLNLNRQSSTHQNSPRRSPVQQSSFQQSDFEPKVDSQGQPESDRNVNRNRLQLDSPNSLRARQEESDQPVEPPTFNLRDNVETESPSESSNKSTETETRSTDDSYQLPALSDVRSPIPSIPLMGIAQADPSGLLAADQAQNFNQNIVDSHTSYSSLKIAPTQPKTTTWKAHNFYHRPTYFEDKNLERYGNENAFQNVASGARFFLAIPSTAYRIGAQHPNSRVYTYGNNRPGDCVPYQREGFVPSNRGTALQVLTSLGILLP